MKAIKNDVRSVDIARRFYSAPIGLDELRYCLEAVTNQCRHYLIGKYSEQETKRRSSHESIKDILSNIAKELCLAEASMGADISYSRAIDRMFQKVPKIAEEILAGNSRLPLRSTAPLSRMAEYDIISIMERLSNEKTQVAEIFYDQKKMPVVKTGRGRTKWNIYTPPKVSVKDTPPHDPDAQIMALSLTVPSWVRSMEKNFAHADFQSISLAAKQKLVAELNDLRYITSEMIRAAED